MGKLIVIEQEQLADETSCTCGNCNWTGPISQSDEVLDAILTPGDEVPAGRCPDCEALVYVVKREDISASSAPEIAKLLVCTTGHVTREEAGILNAAGYSRGDYGWLLHVDLEERRPVVNEIEHPSLGLQGAIDAARSAGCAYLMLDRDAEALEGVPTSDW